jgi:hypothetical protein
VGVEWCYRNLVECAPQNKYQKLFAHDLISLLVLGGYHFDIEHDLGWNNRILQAVWIPYSLL